MPAFGPSTELTEFAPIEMTLYRSPVPSMGISNVVTSFPGAHRRVTRRAKEIDPIRYVITALKTAISMFMAHLQMVRWHNITKIAAVWNTGDEKIFFL